MHRKPFNLHLKHVDELIIGDHLFGHFAVMFNKRLKRASNGGLGATTHFGNHAAQAVNFIIKGSDCMFVHCIDPNRNVR